MTISMELKDLDQIIFYEDGEEYETTDREIVIREPDENGEMISILHIKPLKEGEFTTSNIKISFDGLLELVFLHNSKKYKISEYVSEHDDDNHEIYEALHLSLEEVN